VWVGGGGGGGGFVGGWGGGGGVGGGGGGGGGGDGGCGGFCWGGGGGGSGLGVATKRGAKKNLLRKGSIKMQVSKGGRIGKNFRSGDTPKKKCR